MLQKRLCFKCFINGLNGYLAYVITLILFPKAKPYFKDIIDSEYVLDIESWNYYFCYCNFFIILIANKAISKAITVYWYWWTRKARFFIWILFWFY